MSKVVIAVLFLFSLGCVEQEAFSNDEEVVEASNLAVSTEIVTVVTQSSYTAFTLSGTCTWESSTVAISDFEIEISCSNLAWQTELDFTSVEDGEVSLTIVETSEDGTKSNSISYKLYKDSTAPTLTTPADVNATESEQTLNVSLIFSENIEMDAEDILAVSVTNAAVTNFAVAGTTISMTISALAAGQVTIQFPEGSVSDAVGNLYDDTGGAITITYEYTE